METDLRRHAAGLTWMERTGLGRTSHALADDGRVWLVDPFDDAAALEAAGELGTLAGVIQLLDRHNRDCQALATRLAVALLRVPASLPQTPFRVVPVVSNRLWHEVALWWPERAALVVAEAVGTAPLFAVGRRAGVHPMLRLTPPRRQLSPFEPELLLVGHGLPVVADAAGALRAALAAARRDVPRLVVRAPRLLRG